jgi:hypothetical protein
MSDDRPAVSNTNTPASPTLGRCHLCQETGIPIAFCRLCDHWFCDRCRSRWARRGLAAVRQVIMGKWPGCCGPGS